MIGAVADNKHQGHAADDTDGLAAPARLFSQMVVLGCEVEFVAQDGVTHQHGHHRDDVTKKDSTNQYMSNVVNCLKVGVFHAGDDAIQFDVGHRHAQQGEGLCQDQQPHTNTNVTHVTDLPEPGKAQRQDHSNESVYAEAGHEIDPCIGVDIEDEA